MRSHSAPVAALLLATTIVAIPLRASALDWPKVRVSGFFQPQFNYIKNDPTGAKKDDAAGPTIVGFTLLRARPDIFADWQFGPVTFGFKFELETQPQPTLFDAWFDVKVALPGDGRVRLQLGQHKAPYSYHMLVWESDLQFIFRSNLVDGSRDGTTAALVPQQQLGATLSLIVPRAPWLHLLGGMYNGDGRNVLRNQDSDFMYVGRIELRPLNPSAGYMESAHFDALRLTIGGNVMYNRRVEGGFAQAQLLAGVDVSFAWRGLSAYGEFMYGRRADEALEMGRVPPCPTTEGAKPCRTLGYSFQAGYLLPIPGFLYRKFELAGRFQGFVRNDALPIANAGDPFQASYVATAGLNFYQFGHSLKAMINYEHTWFPAEPKRQGVAWEFDALYIQFNYRLE